MVAMSTQTLVVNPSLPVRNVKELVALARARPGQGIQILLLHPVRAGLRISLASC